MWGQAGRHTVAVAFGTGEAGAAYGQTQQTCGVGARAGQAQASGRSDASHTLVTRSPSFLKVF